MEVFLKVLGYLSIPLLLLSVIFMIRSLRRDRRLRSRSLLIPIFISIVFLIVYNSLLGVSPPTILSFILMILGLAFGSLWGRTTHLTMREGMVYGRRSVWYLVIWALSIGITQLMALTVSSAAVAYGLSTIYFTTGLAVGTNSSLLFRRSRLGPASVPEITWPNCGTINGGTRKFCMQCGQALAPVIASAQAVPASSRCPQCGHVTQPGTSFCGNCGQRQS